MSATGPLQQALPFAIGALVQFVGQIVGLSVSTRFDSDLDRALSDPPNAYSLPTDFDDEYIKARFTRDFDTLQAVATLLAVLPSVAFLITPNTAPYSVGLVIAIAAPVCLFALLIIWSPVNYVKWSLWGKVSIVNAVTFIVYIGLAIWAYVVTPAATT